MAGQGLHDLFLVDMLLNFLCYLLPAVHTV